jgi:hypothetical protein
MSYVNGPRINFWGGGSTNVDTANNDGHGIVDLVNVAVIAQGTDDELIAQLRTPTTNGGSNYYTVGGWNYYGDHQVAFQGATVSSSGVPGGVSATGEMVGLPVFLLGSVDPVSGEGPYGGAVMVDLDPTGSRSTQIYVGGLQIGGDKPALLVRANTRCHAHFLGLRYDPNATQPPYLTPGSAFANGTFQLGFPREAIVSYDDSYAILSAIVNAPGAIGIVVRFCMFEFFPGMSTDALQADYAANYNDSNPSLGRIIGTIGPWFAGEPATAPFGRLLQSGFGGAQGVAYLDPSASRLTLDLSSALRAQAIRTDGQNNTAPIGPNVDYGDLQIAAGGGVLATTPSLPDTYYLFGGIYDVALDTNAVSAIAGNPIILSSTQNGLSIAEAPLRVFGDDRNIYLDDVGGQANITLLVRYLGGPVPQAVQLALSTAASGTLPNPFFLRFPAAVTVPAGADRVSFTVSDDGGPAGLLALNIALAGRTQYFINFRKYPHDDYSSVINSGSIPWELVYEQCLRYYYVLFPAMSKRIPLNDQSTIGAVAGEIVKRLSPKYYETTLRMPVTRSLSPGKVALLTAYLQQAGGGLPPAPAALELSGTDQALKMIGNKLT